MISSKSLKYTVRILLGILLGVYLGIIVLLNIPYVQDKLSYIVTKELRKVLNTEVSVGKIDMGLLNRIIVEDVLLEDRRGREMLKVARLSAKFEILPLLKGKITITSVQLFGFSANMERETPQSPLLITEQPLRTAQHQDDQSNRVNYHPPFRIFCQISRNKRKQHSSGNRACHRTQPT